MQCIYTDSGSGSQGAMYLHGQRFRESGCNVSTRTAVQRVRVQCVYMDRGSGSQDAMYLHGQRFRESGCNVSTRTAVQGVRVQCIYTDSGSGSQGAMCLHGQQFRESGCNLCIKGGGVQGLKSWKHYFEITGDPKGPPIGSTFWSSFEAPNP